MARIAVAQAPCGQIEHTNEQGDEHVGLVPLAGGLIEQMHDAGRTALVHREAAEERMYNSHHQ